MDLIPGSSGAQHRLDSYLIFQQYSFSPEASPSFLLSSFSFSSSLSPFAVAMTTCCLMIRLCTCVQLGLLPVFLSHSSPHHLFLQPQGVKVLVDELLVPVSSTQTYSRTDTRSATVSFWYWMSLFFGSAHHGHFSPTFCSFWVSKTDPCISKAAGRRGGRCRAENGGQRLKGSQWEKKCH